MEQFFNWVIKNLKELIPFVIISQDKYAIIMVFGKVKKIKDKGGLIIKIPYITTVAVCPNYIKFASSRDVFIDSEPINTPYGSVPSCRIVNASATYRIIDCKQFIEAYGIRPDLGLSTVVRTNAEDLIFEKIQQAVLETLKDKGSESKIESLDVLEKLKGTIEGVEFLEAMILADCKTIAVGLQKLQDYSVGG
ncbi:MAG: SPFH domain-containing protein [Bacteroidales bacterium]